MTYLLLLLLGVVVASIGYTLHAAAAVRAFGRAPLPPAAKPEPVSLLKPLHGAEPRLGANLRTFLDQDWAAPIQLVAGTNRADDPALAVARALPGDVVVRTDASPIGGNAKMANVANLMPAASADLIVLSDSDIAVTPDYLARVAAALAQPGVGVVTCLYHGRGDRGVWSRLGAAALDWHFVGNVVMSLALRLEHPCMGSTIALRRSTLERIGGFAAFADVLADDYAIGAAVRRLGLSIAVVPAYTVAHAHEEASLTALWRHELRWMVTMRTVNAAGFVSTVLTHPLPLALLLACAWPAAGLAGTAAALGARLLLAAAVRRLTGNRPAPLAWLPARDLLSFAVFLASIGARSVDWRGARLRMAGNGRVSAEPELP